jgi:hypothetical protein
MELASPKSSWSNSQVQMTSFSPYYTEFYGCLYSLIWQLDFHLLALPHACGDGEDLGSRSALAKKLMRPPSEAIAGSSDPHLLS